MAWNAHVTVTFEPELHFPSPITRGTSPDPCGKAGSDVRTIVVVLRRRREIKEVERTAGTHVVAIRFFDVL